MCVLMPFTKELVDLGLEMVFRGNISDTHACALEDAAPLLHLIHPGAVNRREVHHNAWMFHQPVADFLAVMCTDMIAHEMNRRHVFVNLPVQLCQKGDAFRLTFAGVAWPIDGSRTGLEGGTSIYGPAALVCVRVPIRHVPRLSGPRSG